MDMQLAIRTLLGRQHLTSEEMRDVITIIMSGNATDAQIGGFLVALSMKGETVEEIVGAASVMRELATPVLVDRECLVDTCGTGGSGINKFNVSTASAFVAAAAGARVAKHGNRAATSNSGSADLLEASGACIDLEAEQVAQCIDTVGVGFLFALKHHGAMKYAIGPRKEMGVKTIFNLLGPLTNPARAERQLIGVYDINWVRPLTEVLRHLGSKHVMVVHSRDGLDEISVSAKTNVAELKEGVISEYEIDPGDFGIALSELDRLRVNDSEESLRLVRAAFDGTNPGAQGIVALNAGAAIYLSGQAESLTSGVSSAMNVMVSGYAAEKMSQFVLKTIELSGR